MSWYAPNSIFFKNGLADFWKNVPQIFKGFLYIVNHICLNIIDPSVRPSEFEILFWNVHGLRACCENSQFFFKTKIIVKWNAREIESCYDPVKCGDKFLIKILIMTNIGKA